jgi:hypothetical protein
MVKKQKMTRFQFENKKHQVLPIKKFVRRVLNYFLFSMIILIFSLGLGTFGYHYFGQISWIDAFYNASLILTGMGPVDEMTTVAAKLFASFYALFSGIIFLSTVAIIFAPIAHRLLHLLHVKESDE